IVTVYKVLSYTNSHIYFFAQDKLSMGKTNKNTVKKSGITAKDILFDRIKLAILIIVGAFAIFLLLALFTYSPDDPSLSVAKHRVQINNSVGLVGAYTADFVFLLFGFFGYIIPFLLAYG